MSTDAIIPPPPSGLSVPWPGGGAAPRLKAGGFLFFSDIYAKRQTRQQFIKHARTNYSTTCYLGDDALTSMSTRQELASCTRLWAQPTAGNGCQACTGARGCGTKSVGGASKLVRRCLLIFARPGVFPCEFGCECAFLFSHLTNCSEAPCNRSVSAADRQIRGNGEVCCTEHSVAADVSANHWNW